MRMKEVQEKEKKSAIVTNLTEGGTPKSPTRNNITEDETIRGLQSLSISSSEENNNLEMRMKPEMIKQKPNSPIRNITKEETSKFPRKNNLTTEDGCKIEKETDGNLEDYQLINNFIKLRLDSRPALSDEDSDENDEEADINADMVAKCPTRTKEKLKENLKANASPYKIQQSFHSCSTHTGGEVIINSHTGYKPNIPEIVENLIPQPVIEHSINSEWDSLAKFVQDAVPTDSFKKFCETIIDPIIDKMNITSQCSSQAITENSDYCNSPQDSSYGTMSPASVASPYSLHSPNPNIPPPKYESSLSSETEASLPSPSSSLSTSYLQQEFDFQTGNEISYNFNQDLTPSFNILLPQNNLRENVQNTMPKSICKNTISDSINLLSFVESQPPIQSYVLNQPNTPAQIPTTIENKTSQQRNIDVQRTQTFLISPLLPPIGEPISSITILQPPETKKYAQLIPMKSDSVGSSRNARRRNLPNIEPIGISLSEIDLDLPGLERLKKMCFLTDKEVAWIKVCLEKEEFHSLNEENQTKLMQTLKEKRSRQFLENIFVRVQLIKKGKFKHLLDQRDIHGHNALYMASILHKDVPVISRFIADSYIDLNMNPDEVYDEEKNGLLHILANAGDSFDHVLADLLRVNNKSDNRAFDINRRNRKSLTPLHVAAQAHLVAVSTLKITQLLVKSGAQITLKNEEGKTPLHLAIQRSCDPMYIKALLQSPLANACVKIPDCDGNTPLHICTAKKNIPFEKQKEVINQLVTSGASRNTHNHSGKLALNLVNPERKQEVKNVLNKKQTILFNI